MSSRLQQLARAVTVLGDQSRGPARTVDAVSARIDGAAGMRFTVFLANLLKDFRRITL